MSRTVGIGVLSWAHAHVAAYCRQISGFDDARLIASWDDDSERGLSNAGAFGASHVTELESILRDPNIDCVIIGSETNKHADLCVAAAEAGKSILLQKPMALTLSDCDRIIESGGRSEVWFSMAYQMRVDPANLHLKALVVSEAVGRIGIVRRRHSIGVLLNPAFVNGPSRWHLSREANRGMWMDDASHPCDWLYWMFGKPQSVMAEIGNVLTTCAPDDAGFAVFRYANGMLAEIHNSSVTLAGIATTEIYGDRGVVIQNHGDGPSCAVKPDHAVAVSLYRMDEQSLGWQDQHIPIPNSQGERIAGVARPFIDALKSGATLCSAEEGRVSVEMVLAAYQSSETGRRVIFS